MAEKMLSKKYTFGSGSSVNSKDAFTDSAALSLSILTQMKLLNLGKFIHIELNKRI